MPNTDDLENWLRARIARDLGLDPGDIDNDQPLARYGLTSMQAIGLSGELEKRLQRKVDPTLLWQHPSIHRIVRHLEECD